MPRHRERDVYARTLQGKQSTKRYVDLVVEFVDERDLSLLFTVGGRWDCKRKRWSDDEPETALQIKLHPGQIEAAMFFRDWFEAYLTGGELDPEIYSTLFLGGSRAGKTALAKFLTVAFLACVPGARVWLVQPTKTEDDDELETEFDKIIPAAWARKSGNKYRFVNGATAMIRSAKYPARLKKGQCDWAFLNEGQNVPELSFSMLRMRTSDTGGIVLVAANPSNDDPAGEWVNEWADQNDKGERENARVFPFDPRDNPHIRLDQLLSIAHETDQRTFDIEVMGKRLQPSNAVMHAFSPVENVDATPDVGDVTAEFAALCGLGENCRDLVGHDYQKSPYMAASLARAFRNPEDPERPLLYYRRSLCVELGDEYDLSDAMYKAGLEPATTVIVGDASGDFQDAARTKGGQSFQILRECGWYRIFVPDRDQRKNPLVQERMKNDNRLFLSASGQRLVMIDPEAAELIEACKLWRKLHGVPSKNSRHSHIAESMGYLNWRVYPRKLWRPEVGYKRLRGRKRRGQLRGI